MCCLSWFFFAFQGIAGEIPGRPAQAAMGMLEIECNISRVDLYLCPYEQYETTEKSVLFGLIKSEKHFCSGGEVFLGETPVKPVTLPAGKYILLVPSGFHSNQESPIEIDIGRGKRQFLVLKLFSPGSGGNDEDYGAGAGAGAGGGAGGSAGR